MSDEPTYGATVTIYASEGGGPKWLLGAAVAAIAFGGGYAAWKNNTPSQDATTTIAYYDPYAEPIRAGPLPPRQDVIGAEERPAARARETRRAPPARREPARAAAAFEEIIGVAPTTDSDELVITGRQLVWARTPSARRLSALYPERALERGRDGEAQLQCIIQASGALECEQVSATPGGFATAAMRVARRFRHARQLSDGAEAAGATVNLRVVFRIADDDRHRA